MLSGAEILVRVDGVPHVAKRWSAVREKCLLAASKEIWIDYVHSGNGSTVKNTLGRTGAVTSACSGYNTISILRRSDGCVFPTTS